jgi:hypothetical protein
MLTEGLVALLLGNSGIVAAVGDRIQPPPAPDDLTLYPCITVESPSEVSEMGGSGPAGVAESRVIFKCFALRKLDARNLAFLVKGLLNGYTGTLPDSTLVFLIKQANLADHFEDGSRTYCTSFHAWVQYAD